MFRIIKKLNIVILVVILTMCNSFITFSKSMGLISSFDAPIAIDGTKQYVMVDAIFSKWVKEDNKWRLNVDITNKYHYAKDGFFCVYSIINGAYDFSIHYFDKLGNMVTGWAKDQEGGIYFFDTPGTPDEGRMCCGWRLINGGWYCFGIDGKLYVNTVTPDGVKVGFDGTPISEDNKIHKYSSKLIGNNQ